MNKTNRRAKIETGRSAARPRTRGTNTSWWNRGPSRSRAEAYAGDPEKIRELWAAARRRIEKAPRGPFGETWAYLMTMLRLLRAYANGTYRKIPFESLVTIVFAVLYFVSPIDLIPDFLPGGLVDDALVVALALRAVKSDLDAFLEWEALQGPATDSAAAPA
jgi:uncharacterized membrane protein YkvA (DUF1232 family)